MQKKLLTVAVAGALAAPVAAMADVTVYGTIDTGIRSASKVVTATGDDSLLSVTDGERTTNRWGLKGSEDLGGGLRANFTLEGQYASDNGGGPGSSAPGAATSAANQGLFQRKSIVGLSSGNWSVDLGRDYTVNFKTQGVYDPMSYTYTGITPAAGNNVAGTRFSNGVTAGFRFGTGGIRLDYSFGEVAGEAGDAQYGINGDFAFGPVTVVAAFSTRTATAPAPVGEVQQDTFNVGLAWKLGAFTIRGGYSTSEYSTDAISDLADTPMYMVGVQYGFSPTLNGRIGYYQMKFNVGGVEAGNRDWFIVALDYYLSKNTTLYAAIDRSGIENSSITVNGATGAITVGTAGTGATQGSTVMDGSTAFSAGIAVAF
jgi:predicted porin